MSCFSFLTAKEEPKPYLMSEIPSTVLQDTLPKPVKRPGLQGDGTESSDPLKPNVVPSSPRFGKQSKRRKKKDLERKVEQIYHVEDDEELLDKEKFSFMKMIPFLNRKKKKDIWDTEELRKKFATNANDLAMDVALNSSGKKKHHKRTTGAYSAKTVWTFPRVRSITSLVSTRKSNYSVISPEEHMKRMQSSKESTKEDFEIPVDSVRTFDPHSKDSVKTEDL